MRTLLLVACVCYHAHAAQQIFVSEIHDPTGQLMARSIAVLDTQKASVALNFWLADSRGHLNIADAMGRPVVAMKQIAPAKAQHWQLSAHDYGGLLQGKIQLQYQAPGTKRTMVANFKRDFSAALYEVRITNLTRGQTFAPPLAVSHENGYALFTPGQPAPTGLDLLAEEGDASAMLATALSNESVFHGTIGSEPIGPGQTVSVLVVASNGHSKVSLAGMLVSTNDVFFGVNGLYAAPFAPFKTQGGLGPVDREMVWAWDAGTEANNEDCGFIPGPPCHNPNVRAPEGSEGYVYMANGIHGIGDLEPSEHTWLGPVAMVEIQRTQQEQVLVLQGVTVIDGTGVDPLENVTVVVEGDRIVSVGPDIGNYPPGAQVIQAQGQYVVPGLIDMHTHYWESGSIWTAPAWADMTGYVSWDEHTNWVRSRAPYTLSRYLCSGVTTMVEMGGPFESFDLRWQTKDWPHTAQMMLAGRGIVNFELPGFNYWLPEDGALVGHSEADEALALLDANLEKDIQLIKLAHLPIGPVENWLPAFDAILSRSHDHNLPVSIHVTEMNDAKAFVQHGVDLLAHPPQDDLVDDAFIQAALAEGTAVTTTLYLYQALANVFSGNPDLLPVESQCGDHQIVASWDYLNQIPELPAPDDLLAIAETLTEIKIENIRRLHQAGVPIVAGSDAGNIGLLGGASLHREFDLMAQAGMDPMAILVAATYNSARVLRMEGELGSIQPGLRADLLVLPHNPLEDIDHLADMRFVIKGGQLMPHETLKQLRDATPPIDPHAMKTAIQNIHLDGLGKVSRKLCH